VVRRTHHPPIVQGRGTGRLRRPRPPWPSAHAHAA
jgi:hypothetical protein